MIYLPGKNHFRQFRKGIRLVLLSFILIACSDVRVAQTTPVEPVEIKEAFKKAFNSASSEEFRLLFSKEMKGRNSVEKLNSTFKSTLNYAGEIQYMQLEEIIDHSYVYKSVHKTSSLKVVFEMDSDGQLSSMFVENYVCKNAPLLERNISELSLPFEGEWYVFWGGRGITENYHNAYPNMYGAFDFWVMGKMENHIELMLSVTKIFTHLVKR